MPLEEPPCERVYAWCGWVVLGGIAFALGGACISCRCCSCRCCSGALACPQVGGLPARPRRLRRSAAQARRHVSAAGSELGCWLGTVAGHGLPAPSSRRPTAHFAEPARSFLHGWHTRPRAALLRVTHAALLPAGWARRVWTSPPSSAPASFRGSWACCAACCGRGPLQTWETTTTARHCTSRQVSGQRSDRRASAAARWQRSGGSLQRAAVAREARRHAPMRVVAC